MFHQHQIGLNRRELLQAGYSGLLGVGLPTLFASQRRAAAAIRPVGESRKPKSMVIVFLTGACSHHDTFDMKLEAPAEIRGQFQPIATKIPGYQICEHLPELARRAGRVRRFNSSALVGPDGGLIGHYRKVHLPGDREPQPGFEHQHLEKRYFETGDLGFPVWRGFGGIVGMLICNDRRWPESYRVLGLQGVDMVFCGYNTPVHHPGAPDHDRLGQFHNELSMQSGAYQNSCWVVGIAKAGLEEGVDMIAGSCIIAPNGEIVARATATRRIIGSRTLPRIVARSP